MYIMLNQIYTNALFNQALSLSLVEQPNSMIPIPKLNNAYATWILWFLPYTDEPDFT